MFIYLCFVNAMKRRLKQNEMGQNKNLASSIISDKTRVSTAAIFYDEWFGERWQIETFIFSKDSTISTTQIIHGNVSFEEDIIESKGATIEKAIKIHNYISNNLLKKYCNEKTKHI